ncbi:MAG: hypothetical protein K940chlam2_00960 [Chlamydiae bacterium]|nr:hypothetical protein [Chlamydiota bacterium]
MITIEAPMKKLTEAGESVNLSSALLISRDFLPSLKYLFYTY